MTCLRINLRIMSVNRAPGCHLDFEVWLVQNFCMAGCLSLIVKRPCFLYSLAPVHSLLVDVFCIVGACALFTVAGRRTQTRRSRRPCRCTTPWWRRGLTGATTSRTSSPRNGQNSVTVIASWLCAMCPSYRQKMRRHFSEQRWEWSDGCVMLRWKSEFQVRSWEKD